MGSFYVNFSVKASDPRRVADILLNARRTAFVTPAKNGYVVVYDEEADSQAEEPILEVGAALSRELDTAVLAVLNHDDDILCYWLFEGGHVRDKYNSRPNYFGMEEEEDSGQGGDAQVLCSVLGAGAAPPTVNAILRDDFVFATEQHQMLAEALGLPAGSAGYGYRYVSNGELDDEIEGSLIRVG
jgi:hypothetical protein